MENLANLVEVVEVGRGVFSVERQTFWAAVVNCLMIRVDEFELKDFS